MNESKTTFTFVGVAAILALAAVGSHFLNRPTNSADFELVGKPFFEEFTSASQAQSLEVVAVDPESARLKRFSVENQNGLWRIPSHFNYPAEAAARLATTASSVMGINRDSLAGRLAKEHERLGVLDPLADDIEDPEGVGKRITLKDEQGEVVVDYIIGKEAGDVVLTETEQPFGNRSDEKYYYVRRPDEQQTYKVKLDIDLSTKFSDWIDPDLLRLDRNTVTKISIDNYTLEEERSNPLAQTKSLFKAQGDKLDISRKSSTDSWELAGLKAEDEELQTSRINEMLNVFDEMKIAGVRPKYKYKDHLLLTADLKLNQRPEFEKNPQEFGRAINRLQNELDQKGFNLAGNAKKMELVAQHGDLEVGTDTGLVYTLHVGKAFDGDEEAIEIGSNGNGESETDSSAAVADSGADGKKDAADSSDEDSDPDKPEDEKVEEAKNRYLMVRVSFDPSLITPQPVEPVAPVAPVKPEGYEPPPEETEQSTPASDETKQEDDAVAKPPADVTPERNPEFVKYDEANKAFQDQRIDFELAKTKFKSDTEEFEKKVEEGKKLVAELNERFGDWYYVISGDNLTTLQTERTDLVTKIEKPPGDPVAPTARPDISFPELPDSVKVMGIKPNKESGPGATSDKEEEKAASDKAGETPKPPEKNPDSEGETKSPETKEADKKPEVDAESKKEATDDKAPDAPKSGDKPTEEPSAPKSGDQPTEEPSAPKSGDKPPKEPSPEPGKNAEPEASSTAGDKGNGN